MEAISSESDPTISSEASFSSSSNSFTTHGVNFEYEVESLAKLEKEQHNIHHAKREEMKNNPCNSFVDQAQLARHKLLNLKIPHKFDSKIGNEEEFKVEQKDIISSKMNDQCISIGEVNATNEKMGGETKIVSLEAEKKANFSNIPLNMLSSKGSNFKGILQLRRDSVTGKLTLVERNPSEEDFKKIAEKIKAGSSNLKNVNNGSLLQNEPLKPTNFQNTINESKRKVSEINSELDFVEINDTGNESTRTFVLSESKEENLRLTAVSYYSESNIVHSIDPVKNTVKAIYNSNITYPPPKRKRGRPRKHVQVETEKSEIKASTFSKIQDLNVDYKHNIYNNEVDNDTTGEIDNPGEDMSTVDANNDNEAFEPVKDFVAARARVRDIYKKWRKKYEVVDGKQKIPAYKLAAAKQAKRQVLIRQSQKHSVFRTWDSVLSCKDRMEEEHRTKFLQTSQTRNHKMDKPLPGKNVLFQLTRTKGVSATVPYNGIPFMWIGHITYRCHLSGDRPSAKKRKDMLTFSGERQRKFTNSKKLGCPAVFTVTKVARFPDFEVSDESHCATTVGGQLREAWANHPEKCRFYLEYHVRRPLLEDHQFHDQAQSVVGLGKFQEPVDSRILKRIHELTYDGVIGAKAMREYINDFVYNILFKDRETPDPARRRYNPTNTDIRNAMKKARLQMRLAGISAMQVACKGVMRELSSVISNTTNEEYLNNLRDHLVHLTSTVKDGHSLQPFLEAHPPKVDSPNKIAPVAKKLKIKKEAEGLEAPQTVQAIVQYPTHIPTQAETDQATQILYHYNDQSDHQPSDNQYEETVTEVYYYPSEGYVEHVQQVQTQL